LAVALTVAGQWRNFTAFPNILAFAVVKFAALYSGSHYAMEQISMTSTFIDENRRRSQRAETVLRKIRFREAAISARRKRKLRGKKKW
jgi:hypothetical protein